MELYDQVYLSQMIEWFLNADFSHGIIIGVTSNLLCIFDI